MGTYTDAVITALAILFVSAVIIFSLILKHLKDRQRWERIAEENYLLGRDEASALLRETCDKIQEDRELLAGKSDRALLTEVILSLGSLGRRIDRLDDKLKSISHYKTHTRDMNEKAQKLTQSFVRLEQDIAQSANAIDGLRGTIGETGDRIDQLITELSGMGKLHQAISSYASQLSSIELTLEYLQEKTAGIVADMDTVMTTHDQSPAKRLKTVEMEITGLSLLVNAMHDAVTELSAASQQLDARLDSTDPDGITTALDRLSREMKTMQDILNAYLPRYSETN